MNQPTRNTVLSSLSVLLALLSAPAWPSGIAIPPGATVKLGRAVVDLGCADLMVGGRLYGESSELAANNLTIAAGGKLAAGSNDIYLAGSWENYGSFDAGTGTVTMEDGCGAAPSLLAGANVFNNLTVQSTAGATVELEAGEVQYVVGDLLIAGANGLPLTLASTDENTPAEIRYNATASIEHANLDNVIVEGGCPEWLCPTGFRIWRLAIPE